MSLAFVVNLATRTNRSDLLRAMLDSMADRAACYVFDGRHTPFAIGQRDVDDLISRFDNCSIVLARDSTRSGLSGPIAGFIGNESLGIAKLQYLIDANSPEPIDNIPRQTVEILGLYIRMLFADCEWIENVTVPSNVKLLDGLFQLSVESDDVSRITLTDIKHRPQSARKMA